MCALFYDYSAQVPANHRQVCASWGELDPVLAVGLENKEIHFFTDEGEKFPNAAIYSRPADIMMTSWQPRGRALAVGWSDGMISLWIHKDNTSREVNSPHSVRITLLRWAPSGNRLVSADENGMVAVWKVDARSQLSLATTYSRQGSITHLAFATVSSTQQRNRDKQQQSLQPLVCPSFFFGGEIGSIHYADDLGHISDIQVLNHAVDAMLFHEEQNSLVVITRGQQLVVFQIDAVDGKVKPTVRFKLSISSDGGLREAKWAGPGLLAIASGEPLIRFWSMQADENSVLNLPKTPGSTAKYQVTSIDFSPQRRILAAATVQGEVYFWRCTSVVITSAFKAVDNDKPSASAVALSQRWDLIFTSMDMKASIARISWSTAYATLFAATTEGAVVLFHEGSMQRALSGDTAVIQSRPTELSIERYRDGTITQSTLDSSLRIKGLSHDGACLVVWGGSKAEVFELRNESGGSSENKRVAQFKCSSTAMVLRGDSIYRTQGNHVEICNMQGVVKKTISFTEAEGKPNLLSVQNKFLAVATDRGLLRVFDLKSRDPKATGSMGNFLEAFNGETKKASMRAIAVNADGTRVGILAERVEGALKIRMPISKLYLFQSDLNIFQQYDFGVNKYPLSVFFDPVEPRLLACETYKTKPDPLLAAATSAASSKGDGDEGSGQRMSALSEKEITVCFASNDHGILMQDSFDLDLKYNALMGIQVPRIFLVAQADHSASKADASGFAYLRTKIMRDFVGLDKVNDAARQALIDFCYFMTIGNMDEAYRSVKLIDNPSVWENMAHMCVKTKRLDVAEVCLGNMGHARGAAAVSEAKKEPQLEVPIAMVAIQLGLRDEAANLYRQCGRYDQLNFLYQASGYWQKAIDVAAKRDRIHLKTTHYQLAQHYEALGDIKEAMEAYEDAGTHHKDIPRMLFKLDKLDLLQKYISTSKDRDLLIWWAQFQESQGHFDLAIESYERAKDDLSIVRVLCFKKDFKAAAKVVESCPSNRAAAYHLARQLEAMGEIAKAIQFYAQGACYSHTIRLAKEHQMDAELMSYALMSKPSDMLECATYFESRREMEKAVQLYHKGGNVARALELCFSAQLFDELHYLTDELGPSNTSAQMLKRCADFFVENGHHAKAVHLLLIGSRIVEALDVCLQYKVKITEEMAEKMTPPKDESGGEDKIAQKKRTEVLLKLAKCCKQQGAYHLATKKYTQAGEKMKAMKCLLKSGDTEKVVFFANVSRNNDIYVLAANYLQTLDWRKDGEILKSIIGFYTKARAFEQLSNFYQSCAVAEIEEYRDYEKALGALQEAVKVLSKGKSESKERLLQALEAKILLIEQFVSVRQQMRQQQSGAELVAIVSKLLEEPGIDQAIRMGDAYALIAEAHYQDGDLKEAHSAMEAMKARGLAVRNYLDPRIVQEVHHKLGLTSDDDKKRRESKRSPREEEQEAKYSASGRGAGGESANKAPGREDDMDDEMEEDIAEDDA